MASSEAPLGVDANRVRSACVTIISTVEEMSLGVGGISFVAAALTSRAIVHEGRDRVE